MCHRLFEKELLYLQMLVEDFVQNFVQSFTGNLTPKLHYVLHYPQSTSQYGSLRYLWCMRFEAKHQYFKKLANVVRNYTKIAYTLAEQHQIRQCWELAATDFLGLAVQCSGETFLFFNFQQLYCQQSRSIGDLFKFEQCWRIRSCCLTIKVQDVFISQIVHTEKHSFAV